MSNLNADARRRRSAAQRSLKHYCSCGRVVVGNPGWASHRRANPDHTPVSSATFAADRA